MIRTLICAATMVVALATVAGADTPSSVSITLWDKGAAAPMAKDMGIGMKNNADASMGLKLSTMKVKAGAVTFEVTNGSKETIHEMVVFPLKADMDAVYEATESKIDEEKGEAIGEVAELEPGKAGSATLELKPGKYVLTCNIPGHYMNGMWAVLEVE